MEDLYDYKKFAILYVDDEEKSLKYFERAFGDEFRLFTASNAQDGYKLLQKHADEIGLLLTDQRMPGEKGVWLLERARQLRPHILRDPRHGLLGLGRRDCRRQQRRDLQIRQQAVGSAGVRTGPPARPGILHGAVRARPVADEKMSVLRNMMIADRIVSLGLLAAGLSHQIRNSLVAVKTFLDLAPKKMAEERASKNGLRNPEFWNDYHQDVHAQMEKINSLLKDLWTASENPSTPFADEVSLRQIVDEAAGTLRDEFAARRIEIENRIPDSLPPLKVDRPKFRRLFELLLKEELATLPAGSRVAFAAELEGGAKPEIVLQITDNGPGLPPDALRIVFDPFVVRDSVPSEYGINLMACFFIVHHHGGKIDAKSRPGHGTTFILRLPLQPERAETPPDEADFLQKALLNEELWKKLISGG